MKPRIVTAEVDHTPLGTLGGRVRLRVVVTGWCVVRVGQKDGRKLWRLVRGGLDAVFVVPAARRVTVRARGLFGADAVDVALVLLPPPRLPRAPHVDALPPACAPLGVVAQVFPPARAPSAEVPHDR